MADPASPFDIPPEEFERKLRGAADERPPPVPVPRADRPPPTGELRGCLSAARLAVVIVAVCVAIVSFVVCAFLVSEDMGGSLILLQVALSSGGVGMALTGWMYGGHRRWLGVDEDTGDDMYADPTEAVGLPARVVGAVLVVVPAAMLAAFWDDLYHGPKAAARAAAAPVLLGDLACMIVYAVVAALFRR
jgi:hypothetical protein